MVTVTYEGVVARASGNFGFFGTPSENLAGLDYVAIYSFDTGVGYRNTSDTFDAVWGGTELGYATPSLGATLTINGVTVPLGGPQRALLSVANAGYFATSTALVRYSEPGGFGDAGELYHYLNTTTLKPAISVSLDQPFTYLVDPADTVSAYFSFQDIDGDFRTRSTTGQLRPRSVTFAIAAVPEPETWALMVAGFGLAGTVLRRRPRPADA